ncbi:MAG: hypothetical protein BJ554DRAFT_6504, partial [Olpidium bornovanus]
MIGPLHRTVDDETAKGDAIGQWTLGIARRPPAKLALLADLDLKLLAQEVLDLIQKAAGTTDFLHVYNSVRGRISLVRAQRRQKRVVQATTDPEIRAKRKLARNASKRGARKRKNEEFAKAREKLSVMLLLRSALRLPATPAAPAVARRAAAPATAYPIPWAHAAVGAACCAPIIYHMFTREKAHQEHVPAAMGGHAAAEADGPVECALDPKEFKPYALKSVRDVSHNTKIFSFALPDATKSLGLPRLTVSRLRPGPFSADTPISTDADKGKFDLLV